MLVLHHLHTIITNKHLNKLYFQLDHYEGRLDILVVKCKPFPTNDS
jgi:hypothetical protein